LPNIKSNSDLELDLMKEALIKQVKEKQGRVAEIQKLAFEDWFLASSDEDKKKLMPNTVNLDQNIYKNALRAAWLETHWPSSEFALRLS